MNLGKQFRRIRRFLRDPVGNIWNRALLLNLFNDSQREIQMKTWYLEDVQAIRIPPLYHCAYLHDWEWTYLPSNLTQFYQALRYHPQGDYVVCHRWETQLNSSGDASDEGVHFTQPWEAFTGVIPGEQIRIRFPSNFHTAKLMAYNKEPIEYTDKKTLQAYDSSYLNRAGTTFAYYREDSLDNSFIPYPIPTSIDWNDLDEISATPDFIYTHDWESTYLSGNGDQFTTNDATDLIDYIFVWELDFTGQDEAGHGMWLFEGVYSVDGMVTHVSGDTTTELGTIIQRTGSFLTSEQGIAVDVVEATNNFLIIYDVIPTDLASDDDESDFPVFLQKYIEQGVLARAYRVNNDGNIKSLAEYWERRTQVSLEMIKKYMSKKLQSRDYRLTTRQIPTMRTKKQPRLPSSYPAVG